MSTPHTRAVRLVVAEAGVQLPKREMALVHDTLETVPIVQKRGEPPASMALRAMERILSFEQAQRHVKHVVLHLASRFDADAKAARLLLGRALMTHSAETAAESELLLSVGADFEAGVMVVLNLANTLMAEPGSSHVHIQLHFAGCRATSVHGR